MMYFSSFQNHLYIFLTIIQSSLLNDNLLCQMIDLIWFSLFILGKPLIVPETSSQLAIEFVSSSETEQQVISPVVAWKTQVAVDLLDSLSEHRLARVICSQV